MLTSKNSVKKEQPNIFIAAYEGQTAEDDTKLHSLIAKSNNSDILNQFHSFISSANINESKFHAAREELVSFKNSAHQRIGGHYCKSAEAAQEIINNPDEARKSIKFSLEFIRSLILSIVTWVIMSVVFELYVGISPIIEFLCLIVTLSMVLSIFYKNDRVYVRITSGDNREEDRLTYAIDLMDDYSERKFHKTEPIINA